ncbi:hypothetical protein RR46_12733 [Papilio xuthus]|uniref:Uncharacterized protein n=1 Tax=Papilio xuthus TaxID=66420 RepID=A0A194PUP4_PAPXU|nr:hypothetical protein RR46_12733 [Papilio xuthus]
MRCVYVPQQMRHLTANINNWDQSKRPPAKNSVGAGTPCVRRPRGPECNCSGLGSQRRHKESSRARDVAAPLPPLSREREGETRDRVLDLRGERETRRRERLRFSFEIL